MALSHDAEEQLNAMAESLQGLTHHGPEEFRKPVRVFIAVYKAGELESLHPDVIRDWASAHGWSDSDARDLGEMAEIVRATMSELGM
jgi:hypothetical protein